MDFGSAPSGVAVKPGFRGAGEGGAGPAAALTPSSSGRCTAPAVRPSFPVAVLCLAVYAWELEFRRVDDLKAFISRPLLLLFCNALNPPTVRLACAKGWSLVDASPGCALDVV